MNAGDVAHLQGITFDGMTGVSPIQTSPLTIALARAMNEFTARFFGKGANIGGVVTMPPGTRPEARQAFTEQLREEYAKPESAFKVATLPAGYTFTKTTVDPESAQLLSSREHQVLEIGCRLYRVPPHMLGVVAAKGSYANLETQNAEFWQQCLQPWATKFEQELERKCLSEDEKGKVGIKHVMDAILRADTASRYDAHNIGLQAGFLTVNEVRAKENLPPIDGGDTLRVPLNMGPAAPAAAGLPQPTENQ